MYPTQNPISSKLKVLPDGVYDEKCRKEKQKEFSHDTGVKEPRRSKNKKCQKVLLIALYRSSSLKLVRAETVLPGQTS